MELSESTIHPDPDDALDVMRQFSDFREGYSRTIQLREGLKLWIGNLRMRDRAQEKCPEEARGEVDFHFHLSGAHQSNIAIGAGQYGFVGTGAVHKFTLDYFDHQPFLEVIVSMRADVLRSFVGNADGELPLALQHLVCPVEQEVYRRVGTATPMMLTAARQILQCPRQGISKRMVLEGKVLELFGLALEEEIIRQDGKLLPALPANTIDRIYYAREILLQRLEHPPTLAELAKLAGLNEYSLKQGFRQTFGKTVFSYLHDYSMKQARQLLETGGWKVEEVAYMVGYRDVSAFGRAFHKQFGIRPKDCLLKNSV